MEPVKLAEMIATQAHYGQKDKGGNPYINHPKTVASMVSSDEDKTVAWLHDVIEDTEVTFKDLKIVGFSESIIDAVDTITRRKGEDREKYLNRITHNPIAVRVKLADLKHNSDLSRIPNVTPKDVERVNKYKKEILFLERYVA